MAKKATTKKPASRKKEAAKPAPPAKDRTVKVVAKPQLSGTIPSVPVRQRPQIASFRSTRKPLVNPRKVRGGVKLKFKAGEDPKSWVTQRILRVAEQAADGEAYREGLEYAHEGQTKRVTLDGVVCEGVIQGRSDKPYKTELHLETFEQREQEQVIGTMGEQVRYAAKLLAGELPSNIEDVFAPLGLRLLPTEADDIRPTCTCSDWSEEKPWCKHAVCLTAIAAERLGDDPMLVFGLRGMPVEDLVEGLRQRRVVGSGIVGPSPVLLPHVPGVTDAASAPLEESVANFWDLGDGLDDLDTPIAPPEISCVLLRRLGQSPFPEGRFPLVGLLATCYDLIGRDAIDGGATEREGRGADGGD
ncbi:MAG: SWIM zinc finger family protein [Planctomycetota bacterium]